MCFPCFCVIYSFLYFLTLLFTQSLGKEMEASSDGERLVFPFVGKMYDISNAALFYAHNGRLDSAQEQLKGQVSEKREREQNNSMKVERQNSPNQQSLFYDCCRKAYSCIIHM